MIFRRRNLFGPRRSSSQPVTGVARYILIVLFLGFSLGCISFDFYLIEQANFWVDPPIVHAKPPPPVKFNSFLLGQRNLFNALLEEGVTRQNANRLVVALKEVEFNFNELRPSQRITLKTDHQGRPIGFHYRVGKIVSYSAQQLSDGTFKAFRHETPTVSKMVTIAGRVESSVWNTIIGMGESAALTAKFIELFGWDIDFSSDTQRGDSFVLILEKIFTETGEHVGYGKLHAGQYNGSTIGLKQGFYFDHPVKKKQGFYTEKGQQMRKFMLRAPLDSLRVTSRFGFRMHPTLHKRKKHNGIDYGAPTGTRVWAVADGTIKTAGRRGAAGKMVCIDHGSGLQSYYMHLSRIHVKAGQKVGQRKLIGRVGSTGRSTGPHLHFGLKYKGKWVNPKKRKFGKPEKLEQKYMAEFTEVVEQYRESLVLKEKEIPDLPPAPEPTPEPRETPYS